MGTHSNVLERDDIIGVGRSELFRLNVVVGDRDGGIASFAGRFDVGAMMSRAVDAFTREMLVEHLPDGDPCDEGVNERDKVKRGKHHANDPSPVPWMQNQPKPFGVVKVSCKSHPTMGT